MLLLTSNDKRLVVLLHMLLFYTVPINTGCPTPSSAVPAKTEGVLVMSADLHNIYFLPDKVLIIFKRSDFKDGLRMEFNRSTFNFRWILT